MQVIQNGQYQADAFPLAEFQVEACPPCLQHVLNALAASPYRWVTRGGVAASVLLNEPFRIVTDLDIALSSGDYESAITILLGHPDHPVIFQEGLSDGGRRVTALFGWERRYFKTEWKFQDFLPDSVTRSLPLVSGAMTVPVIAPQALLQEKIYKILHAETNPTYRRKLAKHVADFWKILSHFGTGIGPAMLADIWTEIDPQMSPELFAQVLRKVGRH